MINHELLLRKLSIYGADDLSLKWFSELYLTGRKQYVRINGCCSTSKRLLQGSILGPILFLFFVNDISLGIRDSTPDVCADNTTSSKTSSWFADSLRNFVASTTMDVNLSGRNIEHANDFKRLGVTLDHDVSLNRQIEELCKKLAERTGLLRHISPYLKRSQRDIYYSTIIKPIMLYGSMI